MRSSKARSCGVAGVGSAGIAAAEVAGAEVAGEAAPGCFAPRCLRAFACLACRARRAGVRAGADASLEMSGAEAVWSGIAAAAGGDGEDGGGGGDRSAPGVTAPSWGSGGLAESAAELGTKLGGELGSS